MMEAGIEGGIHAMQLMWKQNAQEEDWVFILVYAQNMIKEENRTEMLWDVRFEWHSGV